MNKKLLLSMFFVLIIFFSISTAQASDINITDSPTIGYIEDVTLQLDDSSSDGLNDDGDVISNESGKNQTRLESHSSDTRGCYEVTLTDADANATLANRTVYFSINDDLYANRTNETGVASLILNLGPGKYSMYSYFIGDDDYESCNITSDINVLATIEAKDVTKYYKGSAKYSATFFDVYGKVLSNTVVNITVNGKAYSKKTDGKGVVSLPVDLKPGTYKVVSANPSTGYVLTTTFKILSTITSNDFKKVAGDSRKYKARLFKSNGKALTNQYVKIKVNGKTYKVKTNSNGYAYLALNHLKKGTYKVTCYNNDGLSKTNTVIIYSTATTKLATSSYNFLPGDARIITVKLTTSLNDNTNAGKTIKIKIGDKTYSVKTDSTGTAKFDAKSIKKGFYNVEYSYAGTKFIKSSKSKNLLTILDTNQSTLKIKGTSHFGYEAGTSLKVALTAGGVPLHKREVTIILDGKTYTRTTDDNGVVSVQVPVDLAIGNYTIQVKAESKWRVEGTSKSFNIDVFKRAPSKVVWKCGTTFKDSSQPFKVLVTNSKGEPVSGGIVEVTIDGETHSGKTDSKGYATVKTSVALGKYKVSVKFLGTNDYLPSSTSKTVNVKLSKFGAGLNERNGVSYLSAYLKSTKNCQVNNAKIKALVKSLTSGLTNSIDKAKAIFNYVRDNIEYDYYYDSHKGAVGALNSKSANCVDQAHLLVAMYRTAGFKARYVHGTCTFSDGTFGHVWTQVLIGKTWVVGDSISYKNSLGKIKNWNTKTYKLKTRYLSVPF